MPSHFHWQTSAALGPLHTDNHCDANSLHSPCPAGKKRSSAKAAPRSPASPGQSTGSGPTKKGRGTKQAGRRRSRESKEECSSSEKSGEEIEAEPPAKRSACALHRNNLCVSLATKAEDVITTHLSYLHCCGGQQSSSHAVCNSERQ